MSKLAIDTIKHRVILASVMVLFALTSAGCENVGLTEHDIYETKEAEAIAYSEGLHPVTEPRTIKHLVPNSLIETEMTENVGKENYTYQSYSGLANDAMEIALNANIQEIIDTMKQSLEPETIVPYRGIRKLITSASQIIQKSVYCYTSFNANNILSVQIHGSAGYKIGLNQSLVFLNPNYAQGDVYLSTMKALVIDLGSGKPIPLKGLFIDGYDYLSVINDYIVKEIGRYSATDEFSNPYQYSTFKLVKPFDGIDENQAFSIDAYSLNIIFEPTDARFETNFNSVTISIPFDLFGDNLALDRRYYSEDESIFDDKVEKRAFPMWSSGSNYREIYHNGTYKGGTWSVTVSKMNAIENPILDKVVEETIESLSSIDSEDIKGSIFVQFSANTIGNYIVISQNYWNDNNGVSVTSNDTTVFDTAGQVVELADLFVPNYDYLSVIKQKIQEEWGTIPDGEIDQMMGMIEFTIGFQSIDLFYTPNETENPYERLWLSLPFDVFGIENLVIFD